MSDQPSQPQDKSSLMYPSAHRMPTVSAAQALQNLNDPRTQRISTGLRSLDYGLQTPSSQPPGVTDQPSAGGLLRGQVTEFFGPPGIGKTAFGIQLASNALHNGDGVVWIDCAHPLPGPRLRAVLEFVQADGDASQTSIPSRSPNTKDLLQRFHQFTSPTIAHLVALLCHTRTSFPTPGTSLMVIDMLSLLIDCAFPRTSTSVPMARNPGNRMNNELQAWSASRKWSVLQCIMSSLQKLATLHNMAIVVLNHSVTQMAPGARAILAPALSSRAWLAGVAALILLARDSSSVLGGVRFAFIVRADGNSKVASSDSPTDSRPVAFKIEQYGLEEMRLVAPILSPTAQNLMSSSRKRKADEIRDSEDEGDAEISEDEYGWAAQDDGKLPQPPPQWQGSEDILVPGAGEMADDEEQEEDHELELEYEGGDAYGGEKTALALEQRGSRPRRNSGT